MAFIEHDFRPTIRDINNKTELTNKGILSFFEDIGGLHSDIAGYGLKDIKRTKISWVLLNWKIKVLKRIVYDGNPIKVKTWSRNVVRACTFRDFELYNSKGELCVIGSSKWTLVHLENGLMRITPELIEKYNPEDKAVFDDFDFKKLQVPAEYSSIYEYTVSRRDIDINNHVHNLNYLDFAYDALPREVYENNSFDNIEIMYKNGAKLYEKLKCFYSKVNREHFVTIKSQDEKILHAIVKLF